MNDQKLFELLIKLGFKRTEDKEKIIFKNGNEFYVYPQIELQKHHYVATRKQLNMNNRISECDFNSIIFNEKIKEITMNINDFGDKINEIRARNGWRIEIECCGIWTITIYDKMTGECLGETGAGSLQGILIALQTPLDHTMWKIKGNSLYKTLTFRKNN